MLFRYLTWLIVIVIIYRFFKGAFSSLFGGGFQANSKIKQMQDQLNDMNRKMNDQKQQTARVEKQGDYIDYEDVK